MDFLNELENKVNALITTLESMRQENSRLKEEIESNNGRIQGIEEENARLKEELEAQRVDSQGAKEKMNVAAERIQNLLSKLDTAVQAVLFCCSGSEVYEHVYGECSCRIFGVEYSIKADVDIEKTRQIARYVQFKDG